MLQITIALKNNLVIEARNLLMRLNERRTKLKRFDSRASKIRRYDRALTAANRRYERRLNLPTIVERGAQTRLYKIKK